jgi:hypothetical protein
MDLRRVDSSRVFSAGEIVPPLPRPHSIATDSTSDMGARRTRFSIASSHGRDGSDGAVHREHVLVKTTFGQGASAHGTCRNCCR